MYLYRKMLGRCSAFVYIKFIKSTRDTRISSNSDDYEFEDEEYENRDSIYLSVKHRYLKIVIKLGTSTIEALNYDTRLGCMDSSLETSGFELHSFHFAKSI